MTQTQEIIGKLEKKISLIKELEQSRLFEKAEFMAEKIGRNSGREFENDYWVIVDKTGKILVDGARRIIDRWISRRKLEEGKVYFKIA